MQLGITGDTHGEFSLERFYSAYEDGADALIVCGDFGYIWYGDKKENSCLNKINEMGMTILFVPGNHENYDLLETYPIIKKFGGNVRKIRNNIYQLITGEIYNIDDINFLALGGAESIDREMRINHKSWWEQEIPKDSEIESAKNNLAKRNYEVDFIISHTAFPEAITGLGFNPNNDKVTAILKWFNDNVKYKHWYFGHMHLNKNILCYNATCLYDSIGYLETNLR